MAGSRPPGPQCTLANPQDIQDGTLCLQKSPRPGLTGSWHSIESAAEAAYRAFANETSSLVSQGMSALELERAVCEKYGQSAIDAADRNLQRLIAKVKGAADWESLNRVAVPVLGQASFNAGVFCGMAESLVGDAASLLAFGKMLVLAGVYQRMQSPLLALGSDPTSLILLIAAKHIPWLAAQAKLADEQLQQILKELVAIARSPKEFTDAIGKNAWKGMADDWSHLRGYSNQQTVLGDFQAGRIAGRVLYQVVMAVLLIGSVAGAAAKIAAKFPTLARLAELIRGGGSMEELQGIRDLEQGGGAAEKGAGMASAGEYEPYYPPARQNRVNDYYSPLEPPPDPPPAPKPIVVPQPQPIYKTKPMNARYVGENLPGNTIWRGKQVQYLTDTQRSAFKLEVRNGLIYDVGTGQPFDTASAASAHSGGGSAIFVMDQYGNFYASKVQVVGGFHHSSLLAGQPVAAAGELQVENGVLKVISDKSGHYMPGRDLSAQALDSLQKSGVDTSAVTTDYVAPK